MKIEDTPLDGVKLIEPNAFGDDRGLFMELYHAGRYGDLGVAFVQDNFSRSTRGILRGLHFQEPNGQAKLVQVLRGEVFDVAVDVRRGSPQFGRWWGATLSGQNRKQLFIPAGFAHGFCVVSDEADFFYKCSALYAPEHDRGIAWNDPDIGITWPIDTPRLSGKDQAAPRLRDAAFLPTI
jgi:dTDP-4-dehydrorhamnose 3,5-epimerase